MKPDRCSLSNRNERVTTAIGSANYVTVANIKSRQEPAERVLRRDRLSGIDVRPASVGFEVVRITPKGSASIAKVAVC